MAAAIATIGHRSFRRGKELLCRDGQGDAFTGSDYIACRRSLVFGSVMEDIEGREEKAVR